jgi:hypothetical protein
MTPIVRMRVIRKRSVFGFCSQFCPPESLSLCDPLATVKADFSCSGSFFCRYAPQCIGDFLKFRNFRFDGFQCLRNFHHAPCVWIGTTFMEGYSTPASIGFWGPFASLSADFRLRTRNLFRPPVPTRSLADCGRSRRSPIFLCPRSHKSLVHSGSVPRTSQAS